jgi:hypothetical protein
VTSAAGTIAYETGGNATINGSSTLRADGRGHDRHARVRRRAGRRPDRRHQRRRAILGYYVGRTRCKQVDFDANGYVNLDVDIKASDLVRFHATEMIAGLDRHKVQVSGSQGVIDVEAEKGNIELKPFSRRLRHRTRRASRMN